MAPIELVCIHMYGRASSRKASRQRLRFPEHGVSHHKIPIRCLVRATLFWIGKVRRESQADPRLFRRTIRGEVVVEVIVVNADGALLYS